MDIKLKNRRCVNILAFILALYMLAFSAVCIIDCVKNRRYFAKNYYFKSGMFAGTLINYYTDIIGYHEIFKNYDKKSFDEKVDNSMLDVQIQIRRSEIEEKYNGFITDVEGSGNQEEVKKLNEEKDKKLKNLEKDIKDKNSKTLQELKKIVVDNKDEHYNNLKSSLDSKREMKYYINNEKNGEIYTNLQGEKELQLYLKEALFSIKLPLIKPDNDAQKEMNSYFKQKNLSGYFIVLDDGTNNSEIISQYNRSQDTRNRIIKETVMCSIALVLIYFILRYLRKISFLKENFLGIKRLYKKISLDFKILLFLIFSLILYYGYDNYVFYDNNMPMILDLFLLVLYIFYLIIALGELMIILKDKNELKNQWERSFIYKILNSIKDSFMFKNIGFKMLMIIFTTVFLGMILSAAVVIPAVFAIPAAIYMFFYTVFIMYNIFKRVGYFNKILKGTEEMVSGHLDYAIDKKGTDSLSKLASNINNIKEGYKKSLDGSIKSERLKSELITNVSHDLKTPLTSIINYIDLLKQQDLSKDEIEGYVAVLDRKSKRLKDLIEDLFEASKVTSGAIELNIERVDIVALMKQALGEYHEKITNSSLDFKVNLPNKNVFLNLDGKKTWRVFHNLISNALKYSQSNTRVYIDLAEEEQEVTVTIKNIACYEMNFDPDEIFERFKRGDESRSTEGSGLGLAIAKSIVELQNGSLNIVVDGDLFKAIIKFNK